MTTSESTESTLKVLTLTTLQKEVKKLRLARTKLSQSIKMLERLMETLDLGPSPESQDQPQAKGTQKSQPKPKLNEHPAIQTYRDVFHTYPKVPTYPTIIEAVGDKPEDMEIWRECCTFWLGIGWNPQNITGQLERYNEEWMSGGPGGTKLIDGVLYRVHADGSRELELATDPD